MQDYRGGGYARWEFKSTETPAIELPVSNHQQAIEIQAISLSLLLLTSFTLGAIAASVYLARPSRRCIRVASFPEGLFDEPVWKFSELKLVGSYGYEVPLESRSSLQLPVLFLTYLLGPQAFSRSTEAILAELQRAYNKVLDSVNKV